MSADFTIKGDTSLDTSGATGGISAFTMAAGNLLSELAQSALGVAKDIGAAFISEGAALQQNIGGIETLYGKSADIVDGYANEAYKYGISMNSYMEQATSFAAALNQSLGGNTEAAAEAANTAIQDMADNAAKMGTSIDSIQTAYQGFAKQNYTMLDNLKLGYGGTKEEMQRLLDDAAKLSGVEYDIGNLSDVYSAIHVVQESLGLTGVAAQEASETFTGSSEAMQAAFSNLLADMANGAPIADNLQQVAETATTFIFDNLLPMVGNGLSALPELIGTTLTTIGEIATERLPEFLTSAQDFITQVIDQIVLNLPLFISAGLDTLSNFVQGFVDGLPQMIANGEQMINNLLWIIMQNLPGFLMKGMEIIGNLATGILDNLPTILASLGRIIVNLINYIFLYFPQFMAKGVEIIGKIATGISNNLPAIISTIIDVVSKIISTLASNLPKFMVKGIELISKLISGIVTSLPSLMSKIGEIITQLLTKFADSLPKLREKGKEMLTKVATGIAAAIPTLLGKIPGIISSLKDKFTSIDWGAVGKAILSGIGNGILAGASTIISAAQSAASSALAAAKRWLGIASPSKVFRDQVGKFIPPGMAEGIRANERKSNEAAEDMAASMVERARATVGGMIGTVGTAIAGTRNGEQAINASFSGQAESVIQIDGREVGRATAPYLNEQLVFA